MHVFSLPTSATDSFQLGCLIYETYNGYMDSTDRLLSTRGDIPTKMQNAYKLLLSASPKARIDAERFLDEGLRPQGFFSNEFIQVNLFLENITIKDQSEKDVFFR
jgi:SCY1-like protein 1